MADCHRPAAGGRSFHLGLSSDTAKEHIQGKISIREAQERIYAYYEAQSDRKEVEDGTEEADMVSARITELLGEKTFQFSPAEYQNIHRRMFERVFPHAGQFRTYNITKKEWVLNGETVIYASWESIRDTLDYDFRMEKQFSYEGLSMGNISVTWRNLHRIFGRFIRFVRETPGQRRFLS